MKNDMTKYSAVFKELGHPVRLSIVHHLSRVVENKSSVGDLQKVLGIPNSTLSHHIAALVQAGLLEQKREGRTLFL